MIRIIYGTSAKDSCHLIGLLCQHIFDSALIIDNALGIVALEAILCVMCALNKTSYHVFAWYSFVAVSIYAVHTQDTFYSQIVCFEPPVLTKQVIRVFRFGMYLLFLWLKL